MEGSVLTAVLYPVFPFSLWKAVTIFPICKPYIFHRSDLLSTEKIITAALKPLIFSFSTVGTYEDTFPVVRLTDLSIKCRIPFILSNNLYFKSPARPEKLLCRDLSYREGWSKCKIIRHKPIPLPAEQAVPPTANTTAAVVTINFISTRRWSRRT